jgi:PhnB protein
MATDRNEPLDVLGLPLTPLAPRAEFAAELRQRLEVALDRVPTATPSTSTSTSTTATTTVGAAMSSTETTLSYVPAGAAAVIPYLCAADARAAMAFYRAVFGAVDEMDPIVDEQGRVGHAEMSIGGSRIMISDEHPEIGVLSPTTLGGSATMFNVYVPDADAVVDAAVAAGATLQRAVELQPYGDRSGQILDPWGFRWSVNTHVEDVSAEEIERRFAEEGFASEHTDSSAGVGASAIDDRPLVADEDGRRQGDIYYWTMGVVDVDAAQRFFADLFGWQIDAGNQEGGFHIATVTPPGGMHTAEQPTKTLYFRVPDIQVAVARVRELGGTATEPVQYDSGWDSTCTDGRGTEFNLSQPAPKYA